MRSIQFALATLLLITAVQANAALKFETTMTLSNPDFASPSVQLTRAVFDWETTLMSGNVINTDLVSMTMRLFNGASLVYTDEMVAGGVGQPIGGVARDIDDITWNFSIDNLELINFDNDFNLLQEDGPATGLTYNAYTGAVQTPPNPDLFSVVPYQDGVVEPNGGNTWERVTNTVAVPLPPTALLFLAGLPLLRRRRNTAASGQPATA